MKTNGPVDYMFSTDGGFFPATNYMLVGDPGISGLLRDWSDRQRDPEPRPVHLLLVGLCPTAKH